MKISGFTFVRNAPKLYIPIAQAISSILPLVDEMVVALGKGDDQDHTESLIKELNSDKIRIIHTEWDSDKFKKNTLYAQQTDIAKSHCTGDWLFYIQGDEAIHEKYLPVVKNAMEKYLHQENIDGLLFKYKHFWGDFTHYNPSHSFYPKEIRVIKNKSEIHSWRDAQSFRKYRFEASPSTEFYCAKEGTQKLNVVLLDAEIYHYGWARPPHTMARKSALMEASYHGQFHANNKLKNGLIPFDYGPLNRYPIFQGEHPSVMREWINQMDWKSELRYHGQFPDPKIQDSDHDKLKNRILTWIETKCLGGRQIGEFKNYIEIKP